MKTLPRLSLRLILSRFFSRPSFWIWATILLSILITGSVAWLRFRQAQMMHLATTKLETVRLARIDLSKGFLYTILADDPGAPFSRDEGLALLHQAIMSLDHMLVDLGPDAAESAVAFRKSASEFQDALSEWTQATTSQPDKTVSLRITFHDLEHQAERVDTHTQQDLNRLSSRLDSEFVAALVVSAFMLAGIGGIVFLTGRARAESEAALRESEERYRRITQTLTDYIYMVRVEDGQAVETTHGPACIAVTGYTSEDFAAKPDLWLQMVDEEDRPVVLEQARRLLGGQDAQPIEHRIARKDGAKRWVRNTPVPHHDHEGKILSYDGLIQDITERKQAEEALRESEAKYRTLIENATMGISISVGNRIVFANPALLRIFGYSTLNEMVKISLLDLMTHSSRGYVADLRKKRAEGYPVPSEFEIDILRKDGEVRILRASSAQIVFGGQASTFTTFQDITERKQAMAELAETQALLRSVIEQSPVPMVAAAPDGTVTIFNQACLEFLGITDEPGMEPGVNLLTVKRSWQDLDVDGNPLPIDKTPLALALQGKATKGMEMRARRKDGSERWEVVDGVPIYDERGSLIAGLIIFPDITERRQIEEALRESEERYRIISGLTSDIAYAARVEPDGTVVIEWAAGALAHITGFTFEGLEARGGWSALLHPDDMPLALQHLQPHLDNQPDIAEYRIIARGGEVHWLRDYGYTVWDEAHNRVMRIIGAAQDITEQKRAEEALRQSEERYRIISGLTSDVTYAVRVEPDSTVIFEWVAGAYTRITGLTIDELETRGGWPTLLHPDDMPLAIRHLQSHLDDQPDVAEYRIKTKSGEVRWLRDYGYPVWDDSQKRVVRIIGAAQDITEQKRAENLLRAQRDLALALGVTSNLEKGLRLCLKTALLLSGMDGGGVYRVDDHSGAMNLVAHQGLSSRFITSTAFYEADSPNAQLVLAGKPIYTEYAALGMPLNKIKQREDLRALAVIPIRHEDRVIGCLNVASYSMTEVPSFARDALETIAAQTGDVIARMKAETELQQYRGHLEELVEQRTAELKAANEQLLVLTHAKDEFVSNVSHELRTPISSLKLRQRLLESHPDQLDEHLDVLKRETDRLERTIEDLLQLSRLDQRRVEIHPVSIDLNELAGQYVADRLPVALDRGLTLSFQGESGLPHIIADAGLLGQALSILLTNAVNYTPSGGQVLVKTHVRQDSDRQWIGLSVADTGPGVPPEERQLLFDRFFRGGAGRKSGVPGTGLGLAIAQEIINRHCGSIEVESDGVAGNGTTFRVWIPIEEIANDEPAGG